MRKTKIGCIYWLLLLCALLVTMPGTAQQKRSIQIQQETRKYYINDEGKKVYFPNSKTQRMWDDILEKCPECLTIAKQYNVKVWQNDTYEAPNKQIYARKRNE